VSQFVDDSAAWITSGTKKMAVKKMQLLLNEIDNWSKAYGFIINPAKTQVIFIEKQHIKTPK
jgi:hypothetical protein